MRSSLILLAAVVCSVSASFFNGGCGCPPPPMCLPPPPPMCFTTIQLPPIQVPVIPLPRIELPQPCCPTCACGRKKREIDAGVEEETVSTKDVSCNDEALLSIMKQEMVTGESSAVKIALVEAAEQQLGGRFTVICSQGAFSFVTSTTSYCLHSQSGLNCYLFKTQ